MFDFVKWIPLNALTIFQLNITLLLMITNSVRGKCLIFREIKIKRFFFKTILYYFVKSNFRDFMFSYYISICTNRNKLLASSILANWKTSSIMPKWKFPKYTVYNNLDFICEKLEQKGVNLELIQPLPIASKLDTKHSAWGRWKVKGHANSYKA